MRRIHVLSILASLNLLSIAWVWTRYIEYRESIGMAHAAHVSDIILQLALPTLMLIVVVSGVGFLALYALAFSIWKLQNTDRRAGIRIFGCFLLVCAAAGTAYAAMYHDVDIGPLALISFLILFPAFWAVLAIPFALYKAYIDDREGFQFIRR